MLSDKVKYSDDGEPHATAGIRILNAIDYHNLTNVSIILIRYFGGTKLGVGSLGIAYFTAANSVLEKSKIIGSSLCLKILVTINFNHINYLLHLIKTHQVIIEESNFSTNASYKLLIKRNNLEKFKIDFQKIFTSSSELFITSEFFVFNCNLDKIIAINDI